MNSTRIPLPATPEGRQLEIQTWNIAFESVLESLAGGLPFDVACREYHQPLSITRFRSWIFANEKRRNAYHMAKAIGAETVEDDLIRISDGLNPDGSPSMNDVARSNLQISTRKWLLQVWNRKRYGDVKHIEQHTTANLTATTVHTLSSEDLQRRLLSSLGLEQQEALTFEDEEQPDDNISTRG